MRISIETLISQRGDRPGILSFEGSSFEGYSLEELLREKSDWILAEFEGAEGFRVVLSREEIQEGDVWLIREEGWRLVILGDIYHRRWCRGVDQIILDEGEGF